LQLRKSMDIQDEEAKQDDLMLSEDEKLNSPRPNLLASDTPAVFSPN
jgi:hypothetical protein